MDTASTIPPAEPILLAGVRKAFGPLQAVAGVDLRVPRGELFGLIGHNGAGKSTLFRVMLGLTTADAGRVEVAGVAVGGPQWREARRRIGYLPEQLALYDNLSGRETLAFFAKLKGAARTQIDSLLDLVGLAHAAGRAVRTYSKGMRQRLGLAQALLGEPQVLFLDEPTNGLDPQAIKEFYELLGALSARGTTILITSHILAELQQRVDRLAIMASGKVVAQGSVDTLREQLDLPLVVALRGRSEVLEAARAAVGDCARALALPEALQLQCERARKMELLARLAPLAGQLADLQILEPTLEDLYFGVAA